MSDSPDQAYSVPEQLRLNTDEFGDANALVDEDFPGPDDQNLEEIYENPGELVEEDLA